MSPDDPRADDKLDEALEETFPASDSPANTVETGIRIGDSSSAGVGIFNNTALSRFELTIHNQTAFLVYQRTADTLTLIHTEVPEPLRGRHLGDELIEFALNVGRAAG